MLQSLGHLATAGCPISNCAKKTKKNILMIIFQNKKKIVLHVPKTGGTFLKSILLNTKKKIFIF